MVQPEILEKLDKLPEPLQTEVLHYIEFLLEKYVKVSSHTEFPVPESPQKKRQAGLMKGKIRMSEDFDALVEDLKDYM